MRTHTRLSDARNDAGLRRAGLNMKKPEESRGGRGVRGAWDGPRSRREVRDRDERDCIYQVRRRDTDRKRERKRAIALEIPILILS